MSVAVFVEGPTDKTIVLKVCKEFGFDLPVRAGYGTFRGTAVLKQWRRLVGFVGERKIVFLFDADKQSDVEKLLATKPTSIPGRTVVFLDRTLEGNRRLY